MRISWELGQYPGDNVHGQLFGEPCEEAGVSASDPLAAISTSWC